MYEQLGFETLSPLAASAIFGVLVGIAFGVVAQRSRFCLRRALVEADTAERASARSVWLAALLTAIASTQLSVYAGWLEFSAHRFHETTLPLVSIVIGGLLFGTGMILTRGCASRLSVLAGSGNLRALTVLLVFAVAAHATLKGVLAPARALLSQFTVPSELPALITGSTLIPLIAGAAAFTIVAFMWIARPEFRRAMVGGIIIGLLVAVSWVGTGLVLQDDFDPIVFQSLSFTSSGSEWLFWSIASTSIGAGFGVGLFSGVLLGSALSSLSRSEFRWESFESAGQTGRYFGGAVLMGAGGVLAGGCTVGAGLSGISTLSLSALLALGSIIAGAIATDKLLSRSPRTDSSVSHEPVMRATSAR